MSQARPTAFVEHLDTETFRGVCALPECPWQGPIQSATAKVTTAAWESIEHIATHMDAPVAAATKPARRTRAAA